MTTKFLFVLGAADFEMRCIERALRAAGLDVEYAVSKPRVRVTPANAYAADPPSRVTTHRLVFIECRPRGMARADIEGLGDVVIDHHNPGDAGFGRPETEAFEASSIGQLAAFTQSLLQGLPRSEGAEFEALFDALTTPTAIAVGCLDHNLPACLAHRTKANAGSALDVYAETFADEELASALGRKPIPAAEVLAGIERDREAVRTTPCLTIGGRAVRDLTVLPTGTLQWAPAAAAMEGCAYLALAPSRPGVPPTVVIGGDTTPACVEAFMAAARRAVIAHADVLNAALFDRVRMNETIEVSDGRVGMVYGVDVPNASVLLRMFDDDTTRWFHRSVVRPVGDVTPECAAARDACDAFTKVCAGARNGEGVYGDPARGFAGTYAPIAAVRDALRSA